MYPSGSFERNGYVSPCIDRMRLVLDAERNLARAGYRPAFLFRMSEALGLTTVTRRLQLGTTAVTVYGVPIAAWDGKRLID